MRNVRINMINDKYIDIYIRNSDNYFNATNMSNQHKQLYGKIWKFGDWFSNKETELLIEALSKMTKLSKEQLVQKGVNWY